MSTLDQIFAYFGDETRQRALALIGGFFVAAVAGAWALYNHRAKRHASPTTETITLSIDDYRNWLISESRRATGEAEAGDDKEKEFRQAQIAALDKRLKNSNESHAEAVEKIGELNVLLKSDSNSDDLFADAREALRSGKLVEAEQILNEHRLALQPALHQAADLYLGIAVLAEQKADWRSAASNYSRSVAIFETDQGLLKSAVFLWKTGAIREAYIISQKLLEIYKRKFGPRHPNVAGIMNNMAAQLYDMGEIGRGERLLKQAISIREELGLNADSEYARALTNLGNMSLVKGDLQESERLHRNSLEILRTLDPEDEAEAIAAVSNSLAESLRLQEKYTEAQNLLEENYKEALQRVGSDHPDSARALNFLAKLQFDCGRKIEGCRNFGEALRIQTNALGSYHPNSVAIGCTLLTLLREDPSLSTEEFVRSLEMTYGSMLSGIGESEPQE